VLLGGDDYDEAVDQWAAALVAAELLGCPPLLPAADETDMIW
jgi:hypothetical protein